MPLSVPSSLGQRRLAGERQALLGARGAAPGDQPQPVELDGDVGAHERHRLPAGDRLAERLAFLDVGDDVVEHRVRGADRQCGPAQPGQRDRLGVVLARSARPSSSPSRAFSGTATLSSSTWPSAAARMPMLGSALTVRPSATDSTMNSAGLPFSWAATMNSSASAAAGTSDLTPVEPVAARGAHRGGLQRGRVEQRVRLGDRHAGLRDVLAGELVR